MKAARRTVWIIAALAFVLPVLTSQIPPPQNALVTKQEFTGLLAVTSIVAWLNVGAGILFLMGLKGFRQRLRRAYFLMCLGLLAMVVTQLQVPFIIKLDLIEKTWARSGGLTVPYAIATLLFYLGIAAFARALNQHSLWTKPFIVVPVVGIITLIGGIVVDEQAFYGEFAGNVAITCFILVTTGLTWRVKQAAGVAYTNALAWLFVVFVFNLLGTLPPAVFTALDIEPNAALALPAFVTGMLFVKAGYAFNKVKEY